MSLSSKAGTLTALLSRPGLLAWRPRLLLILGHMRSRSSVLAHILGSNPEICGYSELHRSYTRRLDALRMKLHLCRELNCDLRARYALDKILHNRHRLEKAALGFRAPKVIVLIRDAGSTIKSIVAMGEATGVHPHADPVKAADYYQSRLARLGEYARVFQDELYVLESDALVMDTERVLGELTRWLGLATPLTPSYRLFPNTGTPGHGDPSDNIKAGRVIMTNSDSGIEIDPEILRPAEAAYERLRAKLAGHANVGVAHYREPVKERDPAAWPIKVITLQDSDQRRRPLLQALQRFGLDYELVQGVDGRRKLDPIWEPRVDREYARRRLGRTMTDAEFGCALSHLSIYQEIVKEGLPGAVVLEDDAILDPLFTNFIAERIYERHDLIQLDYWQAFVYRLGVGRTRISRRFASERLVANAFLTTGYTISRRASQYILDHARPLCLPSDWPCDLRPIRPTICVPRIVSHLPPGCESYIEEARAASARNACSDRDPPAPGERMNPRPWWFRYGRRVLTRLLSDEL